MNAGPVARRSSSDFDLAGSTALVTGASRGIGAAAAAALARHGASVGINCLPTDELQAAAQDVCDAIVAAGGSAIVVPGDVTDEASVARMVRACEAAFSPVDVLVTNAADLRPLEWDAVDRVAWEHVLNVNLTGTYLCARAVYPSMQQRGTGSIITVSSVTVALGEFGSVPYIASKGAVVAFTRALSREAGPHGIRVNTVMPGAIRTETIKELAPDGDGFLVGRQALQRQGVASDLEGAFVFLASAASAFVTGQVIAVDGGLIHW